MIDFTLSKLANVWTAVHSGHDVTFRYINTDTRRLQPGEVFIALQGPHFDGHDFIAEAAKQGAIAAIVSQEVTTSLPTLKVADTRLALGQLAQLRRQAINIPYVAVTGSCGKTTTKTLIAAILAQCGNTLATQGSLNNDLGVPITLLRVTEEHAFAVLELGANHPGEIAYVAGITQPQVAVITNVAPVHLEGFGTLTGVAKAKGEIYQSLMPEGIAIVNADEPFVTLWRDLLKERTTISFGMQQPADIYAQHIRFNAQQLPCFQLITPAGEIEITLQLLGEQNILNALAAAATAHALAIPLTAIKAGLESVQSIDKRLVQKRGIQGATLIDDTYNANPQAFKLAMKILAQASGTKILVMGDMGELGTEAAYYHAETGRLARALGIDQLHAVGTLSQHAVAAFGANGYHYLDQPTLLAAIAPSLTADTTVLVKGSRSARMEQVIAGLLA